MKTERIPIIQTEDDGEMIAGPEKGVVRTQIGDTVWMYVIPHTFLSPCQPYTETASPRPITETARNGRSRDTVNYLKAAIVLSRLKLVSPTKAMQ